MSYRSKSHWLYSVYLYIFGMSGTSAGTIISTLSSTLTSTTNKELSVISFINNTFGDSYSLNNTVTIDKEEKIHLSYVLGITLLITLTSIIVFLSVKHKSKPNNVLESNILNDLYLEPVQYETTYAEIPRYEELENNTIPPYDLGNHNVVYDTKTIVNGYNKNHVYDFGKEI